MVRTRYYKVVGFKNNRALAKVVATRASPSAVQKAIRAVKRENKTVLIKRVSRDKVLSLLGNAKKKYRLQRSTDAYARRIF